MKTIGKPERVEIFVAGHEMEAHQFFQKQHAKLSGQLYNEEARLERLSLLHTGHELTERQRNAFLIANQSTYRQLGSLDGIMQSLRAAWENRKRP